MNKRDNRTLKLYNVMIAKETVFEELDALLAKHFGGPELNKARVLAFVLIVEDKEAAVDRAQQMGMVSTDVYFIQSCINEVEQTSGTTLEQPGGMMFG